MNMIRQAREGDLIDILDIYNDAILNTTAVYSYKAQTLEDRTAWLCNKIDDGYPVFVYDDGVEVFGFSTYGPFRAWPAYKYTIEHSVYVAPQARGKGVGISLMRALIADAVGRGYATMVAGIDSENTISIRMHEKLGFKFSGTITKAGYKFGRWLDLAFYQLDLGGPEEPSED
ncbi:GNAT family N-acetyltransferase [Fundidesulfovibrio terrae]|uniref:GNAT family N-acetyltransferase n=1 Tax=Fundidesulfovibrio terrae TaxID=2922866 RepID=UPI001FAF7EB5|nr:GNAT family N-acetyltransferase [Fundidesulfovibrio terrae]